MAASRPDVLLDCPVCETEFGVSGLGAIGVSDGDVRPCSWKCKEVYDGD